MKRGILELIQQRVSQSWLAGIYGVSRSSMNRWQVYYQGKSIAGFNPQNFACIKNYFCWNESQVLFIDTPVADLDAASFIVDSCDYDCATIPTSASLCGPIGPKPTEVICQVHDTDHNLVLEHKAPL